jgi:hypothetical protein
MPIGGVLVGSMGKNIGLLVAEQVKTGAGGEEFEARLGQVAALFADQQCIQLIPERVQMQHVGGGVVQWDI